MDKTWKPTVAGVLCILSGAADLALGTLILAVGGIVRQVLAFTGLGRLVSMVILISPIWFVLGVVAIIGGVCALRRKTWGLALAGSICAISGCSVLGILAIIFVAIAKKEFE